jgi:oligopeptide transport system ATP-binding protein
VTSAATPLVGAPAPEADGREVVLDIRDLRTYFGTSEGTIRAVDGVSLTVRRGESLAVVGESGSGKTVTFMSILGLIPQPPGRIVSGEALFEQQDLLKLDQGGLRSIRGREIAFVFQNPTAALNPVLRIGKQLVNVIRAHTDVSRSEARRQAIEALAMVEIPNASERFNAYPHELSGGMQQRVLIAMVLVLRPKILIADEPTTALDVTIQAQILELLDGLRRQLQMGLVLITHDLGLVAKWADRVTVMYAGKVVEQASVDDAFYAARHPYTWSLMRSSPRLDELKHERLQIIEGQPPSPSELGSGCVFQPRCFLGKDRTICRAQQPELRPFGLSHVSACHFGEELADAPKTEPLI